MLTKSKQTIIFPFRTMSCDIARENFSDNINNKTNIFIKGKKDIIKDVALKKNFETALDTPWFFL